MKKKLLFILFLFLVGCSGQSGQDRSKGDAPQALKDAYTWTKLLDSADWKKDYNFQLFSIHDTLWTFHAEGNWFSENGINWTKSALPNAIQNHGFLDYVYFRNAMYGLGSFAGNIDTFRFTPAIHKSVDLRQWQTQPKSNLPKRFFYHPFVFNNKLWIIGGEDLNGQYADMWSSKDAFTWTKEKDNLPFGKRSRSQIIQFQNKLFLLNNDVWSSADGLYWQKETDEILKGEDVFGYAAVVFDNKIWLLGCNRNGRFSSEVLVSKDGKTWLSQEAPWTPRAGIAATVHKGKIYMTGGKYGGTADQPEFRYSNDVWTLEKKEKQHFLY